jgi:hypothetical protein
MSFLERFRMTSLSRSNYDLLLDELEKAHQQRSQAQLRKAAPALLKTVQLVSAHAFPKPSPCGGTKRAIPASAGAVRVTHPVSPHDRFNSFARPFMAKAMVAFNCGRITALDVAKLEARMHRLAAGVRK